MKNKESINHFTGREQHALLNLRKRIAHFFNPLLIYYLHSSYSSEVDRSIFSLAIKQEGWKYKVSLLLVFENDCLAPEDTILNFQNHLEKDIEVEMLTCTFSEMQDKIKKYNLFFCCVQKKGILLFERNGASVKLPVLNIAFKHYTWQVSNWFRTHPGLRTGLEEHLNPLPISKTTKTTM